MAHPRRWLLTLVVSLVIAGAAATAWYFHGSLSVDALDAWVARLGIWAPIAFVVIYTVATVGMVPGSILDVTGGALFGPILGSLLDFIGGCLGAAAAFVVGRYIARDWVESRAGPRLQDVMHSVDAEGWKFVAFLRLVPVFPYTIMNYLLGLTRIRFHHYILATAVFMAPSTVAYTWIGYAGRELIAGDVGRIRFALTALGLLAALLFLPHFFKRLRGG
jgi:uncharacterized membrane protein YdjX (TVP38/TMEM64 family)